MFGVAVGVGVGDEDEESFASIDPNKWESTWPGKDLDWSSQIVSVRLIVELPFWIMMDDCDIELTHDKTVVIASIRNNFVETSRGPTFYGSRKNHVHIGPEEDIKTENLRKLTDETTNLIYRNMKTVIIFQTKVIIDSILAYNDKPIRRQNEARSYFYSLALAHVPFLNNLLDAYRTSAFDPYTFEVSQWDVPLWWVEYSNIWVHILLLSYWGRDEYPQIRNFGTKEKKPIYFGNLESVQEQARGSILAGKLELMDAYSLYYRGRFGDAVRSAVTAIEVVLEHCIRDLLEKKAFTDDAIQERLNNTRNSFHDRIEDYERISGNRLPGPILHIMPYINGIRYKNELDNVRGLRHKLVHEGVRINPFDFGLMQRVMETTTWLYNWMTNDEKFISSQKRSSTFFHSIHGRPSLPVTYLSDRVEVGSFKNEGPSDLKEIALIDEVVFQQYLDSIGHEKTDLELFVKMSFNFLETDGTDAPPEPENSVFYRERYYIRHNSVKAIVFCIDLDGLIDSALVEKIAVRAMAHTRTVESAWHVICVANHQRQLPVKLREIKNAISDNTNKIARECGITLITATDLRFLVHGVKDYHWEKSNVKDMLLMAGRQGSIPSHYTEIGAYVKFYDKHSAMSVELYSDFTLRVGDTIGIRLADRYFQQKVESIEVKKDIVTEITGPCKVGVKTELAKSAFKTNQSVYLVH